MKRLKVTTARPSADRIENQFHRRKLQILVTRAAEMELHDAAAPDENPAANCLSIAQRDKQVIGGTKAANQRLEVVAVETINSFRANSPHSLAVDIDELTKVV